MSKIASSKAVYLLLLLIITVGVAAWFVLRPAEAVRVCEDVLLEQLVSPASYQLIEYDSWTTPISKEEFKNEVLARERARYSTLPDDDKHVIAGMEYARKLAERWTATMVEDIATIECDAENSFGAPLRGKFMCVFLDEYGNRRIDRSNLSASGKIDR